MQKLTRRSTLHLGVTTIVSSLLCACDDKLSPSRSTVVKPEPDTEPMRNSKPPDRSNTPVEVEFPYEFVATKTETTGFRNIMELYSFAGELDLSELKKFCEDRKSKSQAKAFYYAVIFDDKDNARFPSTPFTAEYGSEEDSLKHVRAIYIYNRVNGFSEVRFHDKNIWDHKPTTEKI